MTRRPPRGKPSLQPAVELLQGLEKLTKELKKEASGVTACTILAPILRGAWLVVSNLVSQEAPTAALMHLVQLDKDVRALTHILEVQGTKCEAVFKKGGVALLSDLHLLVKTLQEEDFDEPEKKGKSKAKAPLFKGGGLSAPSWLTKSKAASSTDMLRQPKLKGCLCDSCQGITDDTSDL